MSINNSPRESEPGALAGTTAARPGAGAQPLSTLIFNPAARGQKAANLRRHLDGLSANIRLLPTKQAGGARALAAQAVREGASTVIAAGGDGTVNEVLNGIGDVPGGLDRVRLGVLPLGTVNVFAREIGMPIHFDKARSVLRRGREMLIDLPVAEFAGCERKERRYFIQLAGCGLDSRAIELVDWSVKKRVGPLAYVLAGMKAMWEPHPVIAVEAGGRAEGQLIVIGNGRYYGGSFVFCPRSTLQNGLLEVRVFPKVTWFQAMRIGLGLLTGRVDRFARVLQLQSKAVHLTSTQRVVLELDGENVGELPATLSVESKSLRIIVP